MNTIIDPKFDLQLFADGDSTGSTADFLENNKKTTYYYRAALAEAVGSTGTIPVIVQMAFGDEGETDSQGNPAPPTATGDLNHTVLTVDLDSVTYPADNKVCFQATIEAGATTSIINEIALIDEDGETCAKIRLLTGKGVDEETSLVIKWTMEF